MTSEEATAPQQQYTHSLKLEETAKGLRISVHVYANDRVTAVEEAFRTVKPVEQTKKFFGYPMSS